MSNLVDQAEGQNLVVHMARHLLVLDLIRQRGFDPTDSGAADAFERAWESADQRRYTADALSVIEAYKDCERRQLAERFGPRWSEKLAQAVKQMERMT